MYGNALGGLHIVIFIVFVIDGAYAIISRVQPNVLIDKLMPGRL
jgi:hypothetical protein